MKKAFCNTTESMQNKDIIELTKNLLLQQKQNDFLENQKQLKAQLENEISEMNKFIGGCDSSKKTREQILADFDDFDDLTENPSGFSNSFDQNDNDSIDDAEELESCDDAFDELNKTSTIYNHLVKIIFLFFIYFRTIIHAMCGS